MASFLDGPRVFTFPLWNGQDTDFTVTRKDPETGEPVDFDETTTVKLIFVIDGVEVAFDSVINGTEAQFQIDDEDVAAVKHNSAWRLQLNIDGKDKAPVLGKVVRKDVR